MREGVWTKNKGVCGGGYSERLKQLQWNKEDTLQTMIHFNKAVIEVTDQKRPGSSNPSWTT